MKRATDTIAAAHLCPTLFHNRSSQTPPSNTVTNAAAADLIAPQLESKVSPTNTIQSCERPNQENQSCPLTSDDCRFRCQMAHCTQQFSRDGGQDRPRESRVNVSTQSLSETTKDYLVLESQYSDLTARCQHSHTSRSMQLKVECLPILDNLAMQLIDIFIGYTPGQIQSLVWQPEILASGTYNTVKNLFDNTRAIYIRDVAIIDAAAMQLFQHGEQEIIRKANVVTCISSILGAHDVSLLHLDKCFLDTFVPFGHRLLDWQGVVFLQLKTQAYIAAWTENNGTADKVLEDLFPHDLATKLLQRHPYAPDLSPAEQAFVDGCESQRSYIVTAPLIQESLGQSREICRWFDFAVESISRIIENIDDIIGPSIRARQRYPFKNDLSNDSKVLPPHSHRTIFPLRTSKQAASPAPSYVAAQNLFPVLKSASVGKIRTSRFASNTRQPWTELEENTLLAGITSVDGPYWSRILALYGRGGSTNEVLKGRNQVQLKDKARNLKLQYLKMGKKVPDCLQAVTGDLRMRGNTRARAALAAVEDAA